jgi:hypothetical protein
VRWRFADRHNYTLFDPLAALMNRPRRMFRMWVADTHYFERPVEGERFVFYPLHDQPEMTTSVLGPFFLNQIALVENIAKSLPVDHLLYVKEHMASIGRRPLDYYRRLRAVKNLRLITPYWDSHDLIKRSSAVAVISGTAGWEALLYGKPVLTFGEVFYNAFDEVYRVASAGPSLPYVIRDAVCDHRPGPDLLVKYVASVLEGTYEGEVPGLNTEKELNPRNIAMVAAALAGEIASTSELPDVRPVGATPVRIAASAG